MSLTATGGRVKGSGGPARDVKRFPSPLVTDFIWEWWTKPAARRVGTNTYLGGTSAAGKVVVAKADHATKLVERVEVATLSEIDDHDACAVIAQAGKPVIVMWCEHNADALLRWKKSTGNEEITSLAAVAQSSKSMVGLATYVQAIDRGDIIDAFVRVGPGRLWKWTRSTNYGTSFGTNISLLDFGAGEYVYAPMRLAQDGKTLRVAVAGHPSTGSSFHDVRALLVDLDTGDVTLPSNATVLGNLFTGVGLPLAHSQLEVVYSDPARTVNMWDVSDGPEFEVAFASKVLDDNTTTDPVEHYAVLHGGAWTIRNVAVGSKFGYTDPGMYLGSSSFPKATAGGRLILVRKSGSNWLVEERVTTDLGATWATTVLRTSTTKKLRPKFVENGVEALRWIVCEASAYGATYTTSWASTAVSR